MALVTVTVGAPAPPVVPFWPRALTAANPSGRPGSGVTGGSVGGGVLVTGGLLVDGPPVGPGPAVSVTTTSSKVALAYEATRPMRPDAKVASVAVTEVVSLRNPRSVEPNASSRSVAKVPIVTVVGALASTVTPPPLMRRSSSRPALESTSE